MARVVTRGWESADTPASGRHWLAESGFNPTTESVPTGTKSDATNARLGIGRCLLIDTAGTFDVVKSQSLGNSFFPRIYFKYQGSLPASGTFVFASFTGSVSGSQIDLVMSTSTPGLIGVRFGGVAAVTWYSSVQLAADTWCRIELDAGWNGASQLSIRLLIDGVDQYPGYQVGGSISSAANWVSYSFGDIETALAGGTALKLFYDDLAINDGNVPAPFALPGDGKVGLMVPTADSARGANWTGGAGGTANLFNGVDNKPPVGIAAATDASQIKNAAKDTTGLYDATMQTYTAIGIGASDTISFVQAVALIGSSAASAMTGGLTVVSNPAIAESTKASAALAAGTHPTNWTAFRTAVSVSPSVTIGTAPVLRVRKNTSATTSLYFESMYMVVEWIPAAPVVPNPRPIRFVGQAITRTAFWMKAWLRRRDWLITPRPAEA